MAGNRVSYTPPRRSKPAGGHAQVFPESLQVLRGTILSAFQGIQYYDVATTGGRYSAMYQGLGRGSFGARESGGFLPGQQVWVAVAPNSPNFTAVILGTADYPLDGDYQTPQGMLVYPQVAGFEYTKRMSGAAYAKYPRLRNFSAGLADVVDGDWVMHNRFGGGVGVEAWRAFLQAGPAAGIYAYSEDGHLRLVGSRFERFTFGEEYDDKQDGPSLNAISRRVFYPADALTDKQPQILEVQGPAYGGKQLFIGPPDGRSPDAPDDPLQRPALIHEFRGYDGTFLLTAAKTIVLQKWVGTKFPIERRPARAPAEPDAEQGVCPPCELRPDLPAAPNATGAQYDQLIRNYPLAQYLAPHGDGAPQFIQQLVIQALAGFEALSEKWRMDAEPMVEAPEAQYQADPHMWKSAPKVVSIQVTPYGQTTQYSGGRASISITEDGSIVFAEAGGAELRLSGGNIYLTAEHDITCIAGRNRTDISGRDHAIRADRHVDVSAQTGRLTAVAGDEASLVGGQAGFGGVLIESLGEHAQTSAGSGEQPPTSGAVVVRAKQMIGLAAGHVAVQAKANGWSGAQPGAGIISLTATAAVLWKARDGSGSFGNQAFFRLSGTEIVLGPTSVFKNVATTGPLLYKRMAYVGDSTVSYGYKTEVMAAGLDRMLSAVDSAASPLSVSFTAKWLSSAQRTLPAGAFELPEPDWQLQAKAVLPANSVVLNAKIRDNPLNGTSAFPGTEQIAEIDENLLKGI